MTVYVINGANLKLLGIREPEIYGSSTYEDLVSLLSAEAGKRGISLVFRQSNHEGDLVDWVAEAYFARADGILLNPGAYTHTSIALGDALAAVRIPTVEVHLSRVDEREDFRRVNYIRPHCAAVVSGEGQAGYVRALDLLLTFLKEGKL